MRLRHRVSEALLAGMLANLVASGAAAKGADSGPSPQIVSEAASELTFKVSLPAYSLETVDLNGRTYTRIVAAGLTPFGAQGEPNLPFLPVMLAVPAGGQARLVSFQLGDETTIDGVRIIPVEGIRAVGTGERKFAEHFYAEKDSIYASEALFPRRPVWLTDPGRLRHQDVVKVMIAPFRYDPRRERLLVAREVTVTVKFEGALPGGALGGAAPPAAGAVGADAFEDLYRSVILNYEQGRRWRAHKLGELGAAPAAPLAPAGTKRVKLTIDKTGMHRLTFESVAALGFPSGVPLSQIFLYQDSFHDGTPDTLFSNEFGIEEMDSDGNGVFSAGDYIDFFARDFYDQYGRQGNEDAYFNKNVYWLSWGEGEHRRITARSGWRDAAAPQKPTHFPDFIHVEQDSYFVIFPPRADCDLYAWTGRRRITPFALPGIDSTLGATLVTNFISFYTSPAGLPTSSQITLYMTGCSGVQTQVGTVSTALPGVKKTTTDLAPGLLCSTGDRFRFESSLLGQAETPGNMLDWFEVLYERKYDAVGDVLGFSNGDATGEVEYEVRGFSGAAITIFDVTDPAAVSKLDIPQQEIVQEGGTFKVTFRDSVAGQRNYVAVGPAGVLPVPDGDLALRNAPSLRQVAADYLVITHPDFAGELNRLLDFRQEQSYRVWLATTDEVYDDFGNGMKSDVAIRRFIRQAFYGGDVEFVLLVGDASVDHRGVLVDPPAGNPTQPRSDIDYLPSHDILRDDGQFPNKELRATDSWFAMIGGPTDNYADLYLGRLPVGSAAEARGVVDKILRFENYNGSDPWKRRLALVADDEYKYEDNAPDQDCWNPSDPYFAQACDSVAAVVTKSAVVAPDTVKYYLSACTKDDQPDKRCRTTACCTDVYATQSFTRSHCTPALLSLMNSGALMVNYQGHANRWQFAHENLILEYPANFDIRNLQNAEKPFIFAGYSCWISDFDFRAEPSLGDAIGEKFLLNPNGAACAVLASACSERIDQNALFNPVIAQTMFKNPPRVDPQGNPLPARILFGEAVLSALTRFGVPDFAARYMLFGDPAMVVDMGPPLIKVAVDGVSVDTSYVFEGAAPDTLDIVAEIKDEEAITSIGIDRVEGSAVTPVPADSILNEPLVDLNLTRARSYRSTYHHVPLLGDYVVRISGQDYSGRTSSFDVRIKTGSAAFLKDSAPLPAGGTITVGQTLRADLKRPFPFAAGDIAATIDALPASQFGEVSVVMKDGAGMEWEVSLVPELAAGAHTLEVTVAGYKARRHFTYSPVRVDISADGRNLYDDDFVRQDATIAIVLQTAGDLSAQDIQVAVDGTPRTVVFEPNEARTEWTGALDLGSVGLAAGAHQLTVSVRGIATARNFRISERLLVLDVSVFPNPFSADTYFFYTLTDEAREAKLAIYTVSGRKIFEADVGRFAGYNQCRWDGRDARGDRVANGTYIYRLVVKGSGGEREALGRVLKLD